METRTTSNNSKGEYVTLVSSDGFEFVVLREAACVSGMIKAMLADLDSGIILEKVVEYFYYNHKNRDRTDVPDMEIPPELCLELLMAADFLDGLYISYKDRGSIIEVLRNWRQSKIEITVVTDGSRILGLGDLGVNGMGIPVGKLALYTGCAGISPETTLPIMLDLGTNNKEFLNDKLYMGTRMQRISEKEELEFMDELMVALNTVWPGYVPVGTYVIIVTLANKSRIIVQFEDFKNPFPALEKYGPKYSCFNDDVQGTGAVILGGIINALKMTATPIKDQRAVFMGAGSAGVGVAKQIVAYFVKSGLTEKEARRKFWLVDTKGLITDDRGDNLAPHKKYFSRPDNNGRQFKTLAEVVDYVKPTILMGLSATRGVFTEPIVRKMAALNKKPIIMPLSNPSNMSECTFEEAMKWTDGRAIFASGSPFLPYMYNGIGLGSILCKAILINQDMIYTSATALSTTLSTEEFADGKLYPNIDRIREVSVVVAREVIREAQRHGLDREDSIRSLTNSQLDNWIRDRMYDPNSVEKIPSRNYYIADSKSLNTPIKSLL